MEKWASLKDLCSPVPEEVIESVNEQAHRFVFDSANWVLTQSSSTSGMYGSWYVKLDSTTTVKDVTKFWKLPTGVGSDLQAAFVDWTQKMKNFCDEFKF